MKDPPELMNLLMNRWGFVLQLVLLTAGGFHLLLLVGAEAWRRRDAVSLVLVLWIVSGLFSIMVLNFMVNARSFLLVVPASGDSPRAPIETDNRDLNGKCGSCGRSRLRR